MTSCEKCWRNALGNAHEYHRLLHINNCTPEEQAGYDATYCNACGRRAVHEICKVCMACGWRPSEPEGHSEERP